MGTAKSDKNFEELPIAKGVGPYNVNQFRIQFRLPTPIVFKGSRREEAIKMVASDFLSLFPFYFNGTHAVMKENVASVDWGDKTFLTQKTLRFVLDAKVKGFNAPDAHSDWVYLVWKNLDKSGFKGFAAQTLRRKFAETPDYFMPRIGRAVNVLHVLAGRRSWIVSWANAYKGAKAGQPAQSNQRATSDGTICVLETAAVERDSSMAVSPMEWLLDARDALVTIWCTQLYNYVLSKNHWISDFSPTVFQTDDGDKLWVKDSKSPCYYRMKSFTKEEELRKHGWVKNLLEMHPALADQLSSPQLKTG
ncbi:hypothetical protein [Hyalangium versicolor]|uniref:hypothetical protein n=1 Tax=Hyalangium versicolor TaxID=2861190 RepID=UPI001CCDD35F|nr:hypothetical protein [Hyalangium versicolor]